MRQQGANQFDKGLNLDTNPIAIDNHTLTGALNATMITMNGNELVLLNDMGNARVDLAQLPEGYVPVGMLEYGGIVYVASYNPLKGESLIGCFPSPQRNFPSTENGSSSNRLKELSKFINDGKIKSISERIVLINSIVRPGDKFVITSSDLTNFNDNYLYVKLKAIIVDSDGSSIDITDSLTHPSNHYEHFEFIKLNGSISDSDYSIYQNRISGKIYLEALLIVPDFISAQVSSQIANSTTTKLTITPKSYKRTTDEYGNYVNVIWSDNPHNYKLTLYNAVTNQVLSVNNVEQSNILINPNDENATHYRSYSFEVPNTSVIRYEIYPEYTLEGTPGKIESLKCEDTIEVALIGSGDVKFNKFKYFNDFSQGTFGQFILDYNIKAYIDNNIGSETNNHTLNNLYLELYDINDVIDDTNPTVPAFKSISTLQSGNYDIRINLNTLNYFGSYSQVFNFGEDIQNSSYYIGRICSVVDLEAHTGLTGAVPANTTYYTDMLGRNVVSGNLSASETYYTGKFKNSSWYAIITSAYANEFYFNNAIQNMIEIEVSNNDRAKIEIDWNATIDRELIEQNVTNGITEDSDLEGFLTEAPDSINRRIKYESYKDGVIKYQHTAEVINGTTNKHFPFEEVNIALTPTFIDKKYQTNITNTTEGDISDSVVSLSELTDMLPIGNNGVRQNANETTYDLTQISNAAWCRDFDSTKLEIDYKLFSQLKSALLKNPANTGNTVNDYKFEFSDYMNAFVPYMPLYRTEYSEDYLSSLLGPLVINYNNNQISSIYPYVWFNYCSSNDRWFDGGGLLGIGEMDYLRSHTDKYIGLMEGEVTLHNEVDSEDGFVEDSPTGWHKILRERDTGKNDVPSWNNYVSPEIISKYEDIIGFTPVIMLWYGIRDDWSNIVTGDPSQSHAGVSTYCIPMIRNTSNGVSVLNQVGLGDSNKNLLTDIVKSFNSIYVYQPNQFVNLDYWILNPHNYIYTNPYQLTTTYTFSVTNTNTIPTFNNKYDVLNESVSTPLFAGVNLALPKFKLKTKTISKIFTDIILSPDLSIINSQLLALTSPSIDGSCAIIIDSTGKNIITKAKEFRYSNDIILDVTRRTFDSNTFNPSSLSALNISSPDEIVDVPFNVSHLYLHVEGSGKNAVLIDCNTATNAALAYANSKEIGSWGYRIAKAIKESRIKFNVSENHNDNKICIMDLTKNSDKRQTSSNKYLGSAIHCGTGNERKGRVKIIKIVKDHIYNLNLFKSSLTLSSL